MQKDYGAFMPGDRLKIHDRETGPLAGKTFAAKDVFDIAGHPTSNGQPTWPKTHPLPGTHAAAVEQLLNAGAALDGKTVCDEMCYSLAGDNAHYGAPVNPAAPNRATAVRALPPPFQAQHGVSERLRLAGSPLSACRSRPSSRHTRIRYGPHCSKWPKPVAAPVHVSCKVRHVAQQIARSAAGPSNGPQYSCSDGLPGNSGRRRRPLWDGPQPQHQRWSLCLVHLLPRPLLPLGLLRLASTIR